MIIRPTVAADAEALRALRLRALALYPEAYGADLTEDQAKDSDAWIHRVTPTEHSIVFVAEDRDTGALVGMTGLYRDGRIKTGHIGGIWGVFVDPAQQNGGIGEGLLNAAIDAARGWGVARLRLSVVDSNTKAVRLYERCGFTVYGHEPDAIRVGGVCYGELLMTMALDGNP